MAKGKKRERTERGALDGSASHLLHRALQQALDIYADETGADAPSQRQFAILTAASEHTGLSQTDLVRLTGIDRSTLADLVARMTTKGLIARERSAADGRAKTVTLTPEGAALLATLRPSVETVDRRILSLLPKGKRDTFIDLLGDLAEGAPEAAPARDAKPKKSADKGAKKAKKAKKPLAVSEAA